MMYQVETIPFYYRHHYQDFIGIVCVFFYMVVLLCWMRDCRTMFCHFDISSVLLSITVVKNIDQVRIVLVVLSKITPRSRWTGISCVETIWPSVEIDISSDLWPSDDGGHYTPSSSAHLFHWKSVIRCWISVGSSFIDGSQLVYTLSTQG